MAEHVALTDPELHEPKGASTATAGQVYVSDGAGSGSWVSPADWAELASAHAAYTGDDVHGVDRVYLTVRIADIGTSGDTHVVTPVAGSISKIYCVVDTAPSSTDTVITTYLGATPVTNGAWTVEFTGAAAGDIDTVTPTANNTVVAGQAIKFTSDGGASNAVTATITVEITL